MSTPLPATAPRPWTEAHCREAFVRLCELAAEVRGLGHPSAAAHVAEDASRPWATSEGGVRMVLGYLENLGIIDSARIDREIALVRQRAERPPHHAPTSRADLLSLIRAQRDGSLRPDELVDLMGRLETIFASEDAPREPAPRIRPCVAALVTDPAGRLLLVRTKRGWELPGGGIEPGEKWRWALARELREETGIEVVLLDSAEPRVFDGMPVNGAQYQSLIVIARGTVDTDAAPAPQIGDGVREARWFVAGDVPLDGLSQIATAQVVREWLADALTPRWTPPPGVHPTVLHGDASGPLLIALVRLDPGAEMPREVHEEQMETIFPLSGRLEIEDGATPSWQTDYDSAPIVIDAGVAHVVRNASRTEPAEYLAILRRVTAEERCGACAEIEHTGGRWGAHVCGKPETLSITSEHAPASSLIADIAAFRALTAEQRAALLTIGEDGPEVLNAAVDQIGRVLARIDARRR